MFFEFFLPKMFKCKKTLILHSFFIILNLIFFFGPSFNGHFYIIQIINPFFPPVIFYFMIILGLNLTTASTSPIQRELVLHEALLAGPISLGWRCYYTFHSDGEIATAFFTFVDHN